MFSVNIPYHIWRLNTWNGLNLDVLLYKPIFHWCRSESERFSYLKSIVARAGRWLGLYVCASQVCVCLCAVGGPFGSFRKQIRGLSETGSGQWFLYSFVDALLTRRYPLYYVFSIRAAQCNGRFYNNHTACVSLLPLFSPVRMGFRFLYSSRSACALLLHPSLPSFLPQPRQAHPAKEIHGDNGWCYWVWFLGFVAPDWLKRRGASLTTPTTCFIQINANIFN